MSPVKRQPIRTCVACRTTGGKWGLVRLVRLPPAEGQEVSVVVDPTGKQSGRGAYLCPTLTCLELALKRKALERSLKASLSEETIATLRAALARESD